MASLLFVFMALVAIIYAKKLDKEIKDVSANNSC